MASACATSSSPLVSAPSACPSSKKTAAARFRTVSCRATGGDNDGLLWLPRRDAMLKGLSGVAAGLAWYPGLASGAVPPLCEKTDNNKVNDEMLLCTDTDEQKPCPGFLKIRQPVHLLKDEYKVKYKDAVKKMKALPESHPLSFKAQASIHQAFCDGYYSYHRSSAGGSEKKADAPFDVHFSWIFAPWHRMYIYFYERALGQLIGDATFALPYWNWDAPKGMVVPELFKNPKNDNPLYDPNRNQNNLDALVDLDYLKNREKRELRPFSGSEDDEYKRRVNENLCTVNRQQQVRGCKDALAFLGEKYCTDIGPTMSSMGTLESMAHTAMHVWVGKPDLKPGTCTSNSGGVVNHSSKTPAYNCNNDMGFLGSAANDPLFYSHHSNVDRMWHLWSTTLSGAQPITDPDWLDTSFVFYDNVDSPRKVRMKIRDVLDTRDLGYTYYEENDKNLPWLEPTFTSLVSSHDPKKKKDSSATATATEPTFPLTLRENQVVTVPAVAVPAKEKGKVLVLVINDIEFNPQKKNKFDVAINVPAKMASDVGPQHTEYAGSFAVVPGSGTGDTRLCRACLCINDVLDDIGAAGDSTVDVVIVQRTPDKVTLKVPPTIQYR